MISKKNIDLKPLSEIPRWRDARPQCTTPNGEPRKPDAQRPADGTYRLFCTLRGSGGGVVLPSGERGPPQATLVIWYNQYQKTTQLEELRRSRAVPAPEDANSKSYDRFQQVPHFHFFAQRRTSKSAKRSIFFLRSIFFIDLCRPGGKLTGPAPDRVPWPAARRGGTRTGALASGTSYPVGAYKKY